MTSRPRDGDTVTGGAHLERRSALLKRITALDLTLDILIVEDKAQDAHFITKPLGRLFGARAKMTIAATVAEMAALLKAHRFAVIILDDRMDIKATADDTVPVIRKSGHAGPILLVSGQLTNPRRATLKRLGLEIIMTKDEIDSVELGDQILKALGTP